MIFNIGDTPFKAIIKVTYPRGSCTCSLGSTTYSHSGGGTATFTVNKKGTWTIKAVCGSINKSTSVTVSKNGEEKSTSISYLLYLFNNGTTGYGFSSYSTDGNNTNVIWQTIKISGSQIVFDYLDYDAWAALYTSSKINLSGYNTLRAKGSITGGQASNSNRRVYVYAGSGSTMSASSSRAGNGTVDLSLDVSGLSGEYTIGIRAAYADGNINQLWLE